VYRVEHPAVSGIMVGFVLCVVYLALWNTVLFAAAIVLTQKTILVNVSTYQMLKMVLSNIQAYFMGI
jgi:hypothetical protein